MSTTGIFDTGYIGAHRWHVEPQGESGGGWHWTCVCDRFGNVAGNFAFLMDSFARHAHEALQRAAVDLILEHQPRNRKVMWSLESKGKRLQEAGETDKGNLLILAATLLNSEIAEAQEYEFQNLEWQPWPEHESQGLAADVSMNVDYWLRVAPGMGNGFSWETWRIDHNGDEWKLTSGEATDLEEAQRASWAAVVAHQEQLEDEEPF